MLVVTLDTATISIFLFQMHDNAFTMAAVTTLEQCINARCCPTVIGTADTDVTWWDTDITGDVCMQALGHFGEDISAYDGHVADAAADAA
jgi:hypothetical protein